MKWNAERLGFLLFSALALLAALAWKPTIYGNDEASIKKYLTQDRM